MHWPTKKSLFIFSLSAAVIFIAIVPLLKSGWPYNHDLELYPVWLSEFDLGIKDGQFLPRWAPNVWVGYGSPLFSFNQPLFFYLAEAVHLVGFGLLISVKLTVILLTVLGYWFMYLFCRQFFGQRAALLSATLYLIFPYHLGLIYTRGALAEYLAMAILPLLFFAFYKIGRAFSWRYWFLSLLSVALLLLSHNISILLYLPIVALFVLFFTPRNWRNYLISLSAGLAGCLVSAWFWLPALVERQYLKLDNLYTGPYDFHRHFISAKNLFFANFWENRDTFFQISLIASLILILGLILALKNLKKKPRNAGLVGFFLSISLIGIIFTQSFSHVIWEKIGVLKYLQFPWRFLSLVDFGAAVIAGVIAWPEMQKLFSWISHKIFPRKNYNFTWTAAIITILALLFFSETLWPAKYLPAKPDSQYTPHQQIVDQLKNSVTLNTFAVKAAIFPRYNNLDKLEVRVNNIMYQIYESLRAGREYVYPAAEVISGQAIVNSADENSIRREFRISAESDSRIQIQTFWFPGWQAKLDNKPVEIQVNQDYGLMEINIPAGDHNLKLEFKNTTIRTASNLISLVSVILLIALGFLKTIVKRQKLKTSR
ncbi:MAG: 6-pyruvoyl-tetrahydropterin synthase-related protein [Patescibacteria group bacterium]|nr:6-pyruvoyl-tetrahydropterin synthase-related protein [Patescibacteria group bacterium]